MSGRESWKVALTFVIAPILLGIVVCITFVEPTWQLFFVRVGFILVACLLPAVMYYLFIVTRKESMLNEYVANMLRLGLLWPRELRLSARESFSESEGERTRRILSYLQKFEAVYGPLPDEVKKEILQLRDPRATQWNAERATIELGRATIITVFASEVAVPVLIATFLIALMWVITLPPVSLALAQQLLPTAGVEPGAATPLLAPWLEALTPNLLPVTAAFLGAYFFSLQLLFRRYVRRDLRPSAYVGVILRILLVVIGIWIVAWLGPLVVESETKRGLIVVGFSIGVFPRVLLQLVIGVMKKLVPTAALPGLQSELPISDLDGLTVWHEARLEDEDIENIPNMATADLLELMLNTRFSPDRLVDWVDQAILYTALGHSEKKDNADSPRKLLRAHGVRTATALLDAYGKAVSWYGDGDAFELILGGEPRRVVRSLADTIETNPNIPLICNWRNLHPRSLGPDSRRRGTESSPGTVAISEEMVEARDATRSTRRVAEPGPPGDGEETRRA